MKAIKMKALKKKGPIMTKLFFRKILIVSVLVSLAACQSDESQTPIETSESQSTIEYDTIIKNGVIYDGSGERPYQADIAIMGDQIAIIGDLSNAKAKQVIDANNKAVAPGFINMLSWAPTSLIDDGRALSDIKQGVTLEVFGEGWSMGPLSKESKDYMARSFDLDVETEIKWSTLGEYMDYMQQKGVSVNIASFVGATTLRAYQMGQENRAPTEQEMETMRQLTHQAMQEGAMGLGSSLIYAPAFFATTEELTELAKVVGEYNGMYISHMRSEGNGIEKAVDELIQIAKEADVAAEIYHLKFAGRNNWHKFDAIIKKINDARAQGLAITADMYTYKAGGTGLEATMPPWASEGGDEALVERLNDKKIRAEILAQMNQQSDDWENLYLASGAEGIVLVGLTKPHLLKFQGKSIAEVAKLRGQSAVETIADLIIEEKKRIDAVFFLMSDENIKRKAVLPWLSFASDAGAYAPEGTVLNRPVHPRAYGTFSRVLGRYVRQEKLMSLAEAIRKLSGLPASNLKLKKRGQLRQGYFADVVVFDPNLIIDKATFDQPHQLSEGIEQVFVNGVQVLKDGQHTNLMPGRFVHGPGYRKP